MPSQESIDRVRELIAERNQFVPESFYTLSEEAREDLVPYFAELVELEQREGTFSPREREICFASGKVATRLAAWLLTEEITEKASKSAIEAFQKSIDQTIEEYVARVKRTSDKYVTVAFVIGIFIGCLVGPFYNLFVCLWS